LTAYFDSLYKTDAIFHLTAFFDSCLYKTEEEEQGNLDWWWLTCICLYLFDPRPLKKIILLITINIHELMKIKQ